MHKIIIVVIMIAVQWLPISLHADTIYSWKGDDGILRFSNAPPPEGVKNYQATSSVPTSSEAAVQDDQTPDTKRRASYDEMVEEASREAAALREERQEQEAIEAAEKRRVAEEKRKTRVEARRKQLEQKIEAIKNRALSRTYSNGMKQAQIETLTKEIEKLEGGKSSPATKSDKPSVEKEKFSNQY